MAIWSRGRVYLAPAPYRKMRLNTLRRRTQGCYKYKETSWLNNRWIHFLNNDSIGLFPAGPHVTGSLRATAIVNIESNLTRTRLVPRRLSLMMKMYWILWLVPSRLSLSLSTGARGVMAKRKAGREPSSLFPSHHPLLPPRALREDYWGRVS